jgi:hypothetical protein
MADLFAEADEALRRERVLKIWNENKIYIIAFIVGTIVMTGVFSAYRTWDQSVREKQTAELLELQAAKDYPENIFKAEKLEFRSGLKAIALLDAAGKFIAKNDNEKALEMYERIAADSSLPGEFRDMGTLMTVRLKENAKSEKPEELLSKLEGVYNNAKSPWAAHARIEAAVIMANLQNNFEGARAHLNAVQDSKDLPESLYQKAQFLDHVYALKQQTAKPAETPKTDEKS